MGMRSKVYVRVQTKEKKIMKWQAHFQDAYPCRSFHVLVPFVSCLFALSSPLMTFISESSAVFQAFCISSGIYKECVEKGGGMSGIVCRNC